ncbi:hypothetical protein [Sphingomonas sp.]|jgi:hypothetical protein|uniref:hypothetical protein n=1 Tax=Sphingomonas sp. TaxID=28214 RepID=UPI003D6CA7F2
MPIGKDEILDELWRKHEILYDALQELNDRLDPADRPDFEGRMMNAELEIARIEAVYDMIDNDKQIAFPTDQQIDALAAATGALEVVVGKSKALVKVIETATALVKTWPVSRGG